jgi:hypothetical protein
MHCTIVGVDEILSNENLRALPHNFSKSHVSIAVLLQQGMWGTKTDITKK